MSAAANMSHPNVDSKQKKDTVSSVLKVAGTGLEPVSAAADMSPPTVDVYKQKKHYF